MLNKALDILKKIFHRVFQNPIMRRIMVNSSYLLSATGLGIGLGMVQSIFVYRLLGPLGVGVWGAIQTFTNSLNRFTSFRINELVVRYVRLYIEREEKDKAVAVFKLAALLEMIGAAAAFCLILLLAPLGAEYIAKDPTTAQWFALYGVVVLINFMYDSSRGLLQVFDKFKELAIITTMQNFTSLSTILFTYFVLDMGLTGVVISFVVSKFVGGIAVTYLAIQSAGKRWGKDWWKTPLSVLGSERRSLLTFAFSTNISSTISLIAKDSDSLWVSGFLGPTQAGYFNLAKNLVGYLHLPISRLPETTYPELSREIANKGWANVRHILKRGSTFAAAYYLPIAAFLAIFGQTIIQFVYGIEYSNSYPALLILLIGFAFVDIFFWNRVALLAFTRPVFPTIINFIGMVLKVGGIFLLVDHLELGYLAFAGLLSGYYIFTIGAAVIRVWLDLRNKPVNSEA